MSPFLFYSFPFHYGVSELEQWTGKRLGQEQSYLESGVSGCFLDFVKTLYYHWGSTASVLLTQTTLLSVAVYDTPTSGSQWLQIYITFPLESHFGPHDSSLKYIYPFYFLLTYRKHHRALKCWKP